MQQCDFEDQRGGKISFGFPIFKDNPFSVPSIIMIFLLNNGSIPFQFLSLALQKLLTKQSTAKCLMTHGHSKVINDHLRQPCLQNNLPAASSFLIFILGLICLLHPPVSCGQNNNQCPEQMTLSDIPSAELSSLPHHVLPFPWRLCLSHLISFHTGDSATPDRSVVGQLSSFSSIPLLSLHLTLNLPGIYFAPQYEVKN